MFNLDIKAKTLLLRPVNLAPTNGKINSPYFLFLVIVAGMIDLVGPVDPPYVLMREFQPKEFVQVHTERNQSCQI